MTTPVPGPIAVIAHYNLLERLEPAGPGELFRARDTKQGRTVAVRVLPKDFTEPSARQAFIEKARGLPSEERSDIYSVGAVLYEMLTGRRPMHRGAAAPSVNNPHVPLELDEVVLKGVAPNPEHRYQSAATFAAELRSVGAILDVRGSVGDEDDHHDMPSNNVARILLLAIAMLLVIGGIAWWFLR